jgi:hypothetical protein
MTRWTVYQVVDHEANPITLKPQFRDALQKSKFPFLILFMGYSRAGKSTRLNQILTKEEGFELPGPFVAQAGAKAVTLGFDFAGPVSFTDLNDLHGLGLTIDPNRDAEIFFVDCEGMDHLDGSSPGFGKSMFALCQLSVANVIVIHGAMTQNHVLPLTTLFRMSKIIQNTQNQIETGFTVIERNVGVVSPTGDTLEDGTPEFETVRHQQDASRKRVIYQLLRGGDVRCAEQNFQVLEQPTSENPISYWNSLRELMQFWYTIATKTLILPGTVLLSLFDRTVQIIDDTPNCDNVNIRFDAILTGFVRDTFTNARQAIVNEFDTLITHPIQRLTVNELKRFQKPAFIVATQETVISGFKTKANELHPFVCESFRYIFDEFCDGLRNQISTQVNEIHLLHCAGTLLLDKAANLLAKVDQEVSQKSELLQNDLQLVENYQFSTWGGKLADSTETKLRKCMDKYDSNVTHLSEYAKSIQTLRGQVTDRVDEVEIQMRRAWNKMKDAKAAQDRERLRSEMNEAIDKFDRDSKEKDEKFAQEAARLRDEAVKRRLQQEAAFRARIEEEARLNAERERAAQERMRRIEEARRAAEAEARAIQIACQRRAEQATAARIANERRAAAAEAARNRIREEENRRRHRRRCLVF